MNGSNSLPESDSKPLHLCPVCLRKLCWNLRVDPVRRFVEHRDERAFGVITDAGLIWIIVSNERNFDIVTPDAGLGDDSPGAHDSRKYCDEAK